MKIVNASVVVCLDDGTIRQLVYSKEEEEYLISFISELQNPIKVADKVLEGLEYEKNQTTA